MAKVRRIVHAVNDYFFDIDPEEPPDYVGASIFYGSIAVQVVIGVIIAVAWAVGA